MSNANAVSITNSEGKQTDRRQKQKVYSSETSDYKSEAG